MKRAILLIITVIFFITMVSLHRAGAWGCPQRFLARYQQNGLYVNRFDGATMKKDYSNEGLGNPYIKKSYFFGLISGHYKPKIIKEIFLENIGDFSYFYIWLECQEEVTP